MKHIVLTLIFLSVTFSCSKKSGDSASPSVKTLEPAEQVFQKGTTALNTKLDLQKVKLGDRVRLPVTPVLKGSFPDGQYCGWDVTGHLVHGIQVVTVRQEKFRFNEYKRKFIHLVTKEKKESSLIENAKEARVTDVEAGSPFIKIHFVRDHYFVPVRDDAGAFHLVRGNSYPVADDGVEVVDVFSKCSDRTPGKFGPEFMEYYDFILGLEN